MRRSRAHLMAMIIGLGLLPLQACSLFSGDEQGEVQEQIDQEEFEQENVDQEDEELGDIEQEETVEADIVADTPMESNGLNSNPLMDTTEPGTGMGDDLGMGDMGDMGTNIVTDPAGGGNALAPDMNADPLANMANPLPNDTLDNNLMVDPTGMDSAPMAGTDPLMETPTTMAPPAAAPAMAAPAAGNARVYFAISATDLVDGPNGTKVVSSVVQGDPVLATIEGEWANVLNRGWLPIAKLSETPVGRTKISQSWVE